MVFSRVRLIDWICARESQLAVTISRYNGNRSSSMERLFEGNGITIVRPETPRTR